jgi:PAS domain S-box-containing protein
MAENLSQITVSRDYIDSIIEAMGDLLIVTDAEYNITRVNSAGAAMLGLSEEKLLGKKADTIFKNVSEPIFGEQAAQNINGCNADIFDSKEEETPVSVSKGTISVTDGYVIVASDISSEKKAQQKIAQSLKEKEVMLAEIHHRVKNNLAVISGLLQMQMWESENEHVVSALQQSQFRVRSIALVHEKLYQSETLSHIEFDSYIRDLLDGISETYLSDEPDIKITTDLADLVLNINQAIPCSLLVNELVINAFNHAFEQQEEGTIHVSITQLNNKVTVVVKDSGRGFPDTESAPEEMGMMLVETLSKQLQGDISFENDGGAKVSMTFQIEKTPNNSF